MPRSRPVSDLKPRRYSSCFRRTTRKRAWRHSSKSANPSSSANSVFRLKSLAPRHAGPVTPKAARCRRAAAGRTRNRKLRAVRQSQRNGAGCDRVLAGFSRAAVSMGMVGDRARPAPSRKLRRRSRFRVLGQPTGVLSMSFRSRSDRGTREFRAREGQTIAASRTQGDPDQSR